LLVVGDEILSGDTRDENSLEAARTLRLANISLQRIAIVRDDLDEISEELMRMSERYDLVLTSGGVGPTCDDVTIRAVGAAFGKVSQHSPAMRKTIEDKMGLGRLAPEVMDKMSLLPEGALLRQLPVDADGSEPWPLLQLCNVFVLPGVPAFFASKVSSLVEHFVAGNSPLVKRTVALSKPEVELASVVNELARRHPFVKIGSYPNAAAEAQAHTARTAAARAAGSLPPSPANGAPAGLKIDPAGRLQLDTAGGLNVAQAPEIAAEQTVVTIEASADLIAEVEAALAELLAAVPASEIVRMA